MRSENRADNELRPLKITPDYISNVPGSALVEMGNTKVLATAMFENKTPFFLKESNKGWLRSEYSMLPGSTGNSKQRHQRERGKTDFRSIEIQRFIGRALRNTFDLKLINNKTIYIDTDVIQADGSTRCVSIISGMVAVIKLLRHMVYENIIADMPDLKIMSAVSVGIKNGKLLTDLDYQEDCSADADLNIVSDEQKNIVEVSAFGEESVFPKELFFEAVNTGIEKNMEIIKKVKDVCGGI